MAVHVDEVLLHASNLLVKHIRLPWSPSEEAPSASSASMRHALALWTSTTLRAGTHQQVHADWYKSTCFTGTEAQILTQVGRAERVPRLQWGALE